MMGATACNKVPPAEHSGAADNSELRYDAIPTEGEAQCSYTTANNLACAALDQWKAANPWWNTVQMHVAAMLGFASQIRTITQIAD
jgi:hypothetical protein